LKESDFTSQMPGSFVKNLQGVTTFAPAPLPPTLLLPLSLLRVSTRGDWLAWIGFFVEGLRVAATESMQKINELTELRRTYHQRLQAARNSALLLKLVDQLFIRPIIRVSDAQVTMGVTYPPALNSIQKLIDAKILAEMKPRSMPAKFIARGILKAVNAEPTQR
jgi:hypothetical protein